MNEIQLKFGSLTLDDSSAFLIDKITIDESKRVNLHKIPKSQGSVAEVAEREALSISVSGSISNSNYDALRSSLDTLKAALHNELQKFVTDDDRYVMAQIESFSYDFKKMRTLVVWEAEFVAHYPFWLAETATVDNRTPTSGVGYTITNNGNAPTRVKIEITPTAQMADACKIENQTNGQSFQYRGTVAAGDVLEVDNRYDTDDFEVTNDGVDDHTNFEGDFITLEPGNNTIVFTGTASTAVKITFRDCWY